MQTSPYEEFRNPNSFSGRRAASYWFVDGLPDILLGMTLLIFGGVDSGGYSSVQVRDAADFFLIAAGVLLLYWKERGSSIS